MEAFWTHTWKMESPAPMLHLVHNASGIQRWTAGGSAAVSIMTLSAFLAPFQAMATAKTSLQQVEFSQQRIIGTHWNSGLEDLPQHQILSTCVEKIPNPGKKLLTNSCAGWLHSLWRQRCCLTGSPQSTCATYLARWKTSYIRIKLWTLRLSCHLWRLPWATVGLPKWPQLYESQYTLGWH